MQPRCSSERPWHRATTAAWPGSAECQPWIASQSTGDTGEPTRCRSLATLHDRESLAAQNERRAQWLAVRPPDAPASPQAPQAFVGGRLTLCEANHVKAAICLRFERLESSTGCILILPRQHHDEPPHGLLSCLGRSPERQQRQRVRIIGAKGRVSPRMPTRQPLPQRVVENEAFHRRNEPLRTTIVRKGVLLVVKEIGESRQSIDDDRYPCIVDLMEGVAERLGTVRKHGE